MLSTALETQDLSKTVTHGTNNKQHQHYKIDKRYVKIMFSL